MGKALSFRGVVQNEWRVDGIADLLHINGRVVLETLDMIEVEQLALAFKAHHIDIRLSLGWKLELGNLVGLGVGLIVEGTLAIDCRRCVVIQQVIEAHGLM